MSTATPPANEPDSAKAAQPKSGHPPHRKSLQSGFSLLARAEPQIWFTGGMLAVCLAMVVSLLGLILVSGLPTFWPQPIDWLALRNGSLDVGEAQTTAVAAAGDQAAKNPGSDAQAGASRYYRTENFDLTNTHYRWFEPQELLPAGIVRPPMTTLIERFEWGHLYGIPLRIHEPLLPSETERVESDALTQIDQTLQAMATSQATFGANSSRDHAADAAASASARERIQQRLVELKNQALRRRLQSAGELPAQIRVSGETEWRQRSELTDTMMLDAARLVVLDPNQVMARIGATLPVVASQRGALEKLKHELSRLDIRISKLRIAVRQAELDTDGVLPIQLDAMHYQLEQQAAFTKQLERVAVASKQIPELLSDTAISDALMRQLDDYQEKLLPNELAAIEQQLLDWRKPLENSPQAIRDAVGRYATGYGEISIEKKPLQERIDALQASLDNGELIVGVPNGARAVAGVAEQDLRDAMNGQVSHKLAEQLETMGVNISAGTAGSLFAGGSLTLLSLTDDQNLNHILSVTDPQYLSESASGLNLLREHPVAFKELVRVLPVNQVSLAGKLAIYFERWGEFLFENPREANTLGGVFPAIWGTIVMTMIMTVAVVPFGVMAALYLREYTSGGTLVSIIRISINNLAGVPSIVYGVFGFSFFCMTIGSFIDGGPKSADIEVWPSGTWYLILWITVAIGTAAFLFSFVSSGPAHSQTSLKRFFGRAAFGLWLICLVAAIALLAKSPFFDGFYAAQLPNPTFGKGGLLWASLTLALLTLPVVIVATEEALSAVPNSLREGSLACGASKWQTIRRIVLPHARPGILTGAILAMARGAGEVAPLMLVGALPNAPELPLDSEFPFFHGSRNFMHLGYQIYSLGFQSQNSEAAKPMVFTCTLLLILIVASLNIVAIYLRARLRRRFQGNQF